MGFTTLWGQGGAAHTHSPPDFHGLLIVRTEEVIGAVMFHGLAAILPNVENWVGKAKKKKTPSK